MRDPCRNKIWTRRKIGVFRANGLSGYWLRGYWLEVIAGMLHVDFFNRIIKSLAGFVYMVFFGADTVTPGQPVNGIKNSKEAIQLNGIQSINGTTGIKSAFNPILGGNECFIKGESPGQDQLKLVCRINFKRIIGLVFSRFEQIAETLNFIAVLRIKITGEG
jgi:hypothetical protein